MANYTAADEINKSKIVPVTASKAKLGTAVSVDCFLLPPASLSQ